MADLHRKPLSKTGLLHDITPAEANWRYVGFSVHTGKSGEKVSHATGSNEVIVVLVEGIANVAINGASMGQMGERLSVFDRKPPHCAYAPANSAIEAEFTSDCTIAFCSAPAIADYRAQRLGPQGISLQERGEGTNKRFIHNIAMEDRDVASSLLVTEVYTPAGHWSSYPPHRHDEDDFPNMTYLEETYYHRLNPSQGFGIQRVFTEDGTLDETMSVEDHDVVLVPRGHHPCGAPYGYEMYYLNVMAGPLRKWRFNNHPEHSWMLD